MSTPNKVPFYSRARWGRVEVVLVVLVVLEVDVGEERVRANEGAADE